MEAEGGGLSGSHDHYTDADHAAELYSDRYHLTAAAADHSL